MVSPGFRTVDVASAYLLRGRDFLRPDARANLFLPHSCWRKGRQSAAYVSVRVVVLLRPFILIGFLSGATGALAEPLPLGGDALKEAVSGSVVEIDTPLGTKVPMRFGKDGLVSAEAGVLAPVLGSAKDRGRWWVDGDKLCTKWFRWFDAQPRCLTIRQEGARIHWRKIDDGETGTGTLVNWTPPEEKPAVVAKADPPARKSLPQERKAEPQPEQKVAALPPAPAPPAAAARPEPEPAPVVAASADEEPASKANLDEKPMMRFGGTGLLEASARVNLDVPSRDQAPDAVIPVPKRPAAEARARQATAKSVSKETRVAAASVAGKAAAGPRRVAAERTEASPRREARRPTFSATRWEDTATPSSARGSGFYRVTGVHRSDVLNVRRGPSEQFAQVGSIPPTGRKVEITGACQADWCPVRYGRVTGWVNSYYLAEEGSRRGSASPVYVARP